MKHTKVCYFRHALTQIAFHKTFERGRLLVTFTCNETVELLVHMNFRRFTFFENLLIS